MTVRTSPPNLMRNGDTTIVASSARNASMIRMAFSAIIGLHGLIHLLGFVKAFDLGEIRELTQPVSRTMGILWLLSASPFVATQC